MSEKAGRGLLVDILIFLAIAGLGLAAIYLSGNWEWFLVVLDDCIREVKDFVQMLMTNIGMVYDTVSQNQGLLTM